MMNQTEAQAAADKLWSRGFFYLYTDIDGKIYRSVYGRKDERVTLVWSL